VTIFDLNQHGIIFQVNLMPIMPMRIRKRKSKFISEKDSLKIMMSVNFTPISASDIQTAKANDAGIFSIAFEKK
jgi:hypothetical protein